MRVAVFVPNFNGRDRLLEMLRDLAGQSVPFQTVVVDNGSTDGSVRALRRQFSDVVLVELASNRGFGPAVNEAVRRHPAEILVFTNNDVRPEPRFIEALLDEIARRPASVAGVLLDGEDPRVIDSAGVVVDQTLLAFDYLHGATVPTAHQAEAPLGPTGGAALVPLSAFEAVGGFDDRIFAYLEDVDLALRLRAAGFPCRLAAAAHAVHQHSATLGSGSAAKNYLMGWSRGYMLRRYGIVRQPRQVSRALTAEAMISVGQLVVDRNASGFTGRVRGWRAAGGLPRLAVPPNSTLDISLAEALRRRASRRLHDGHHRLSS